MTKKMGPIEKTLRSGLRIISDKTRWTQGTFARNSRGGAVESDTPSAVSFCAVGCLQGSHLITAISLLDDAARLVAKNIGTGGVVTVNDRPRGHEKVLVCYDIAIINARGANI